MSENQQDPARTALARFAGRTLEKPTDVTTALTQLSEHFVIVAPGGTTQCAVVAEGYKALITSVIPHAPTKDAEGKDVKGDVFMDRRTRTWCFHADFLKKLAAGVGIEWVDEERIDNFAHPFVCAIKVKGRYRDWSGEWRQVIGSHMLDLRDEAEHGIDKPLQLKAMRGTIHQICATKAKSRAIADACVKRTIEDADLGRPMILAKLYRTDAINPAEAGAALYGKGDGIESAKSADVIDPDTGEVASDGQGKAAPSAPVAAPAPSPQTTSPGPRPESSAKAKISPPAAGAGKTFAEAGDDELMAYVEVMADKLRTLGASWTAAGRAGAEAKIRAGWAEIEWREKTSKAASQTSDAELV